MHRARLKVYLRPKSCFQSLSRQPAYRVHQLVPSQPNQTTTRPFTRSSARLNEFGHMIKTATKELEYSERVALESLISKYASYELDPIHLEDLIAFGKPPITEGVLLKNAEYVLNQITARLAHRLHALRNLPYLIVLNPSISQIYSIYFNSFRVLTSTPAPKTLEENNYVVEVLEQLVAAHSDTIPILSRGFHEARRYISQEKVSQVLDTHLRTRIGTRLLGEHQIALTHPIDNEHFIGTVQVDCNPAKILKQTASFVGDICDLKYGMVPHIEFDNPEGVDVSLPYIPVHLEYIFTELLKNAFRATIEFRNKKNSESKDDGNERTKIEEDEDDIDLVKHRRSDVLPPVLITIVKTSTGAVIRIRDRGGGIPPTMESSVFEYSFSTFDDGQGDGFATLNAAPGNSIAGLGYGLPLSRAYAEFFGGNLKIQSYFGWGTDVYVTIKAPEWK